MFIKSCYKNLSKLSARIICNTNIPEVRPKFLETSLLNIQCLTWSKFNEPAIIMSTCLPYTRRGSASVARRIFSKLCTLNYIILVSGGCARTEMSGTNIINAASIVDINGNRPEANRSVPRIYPLPYELYYERDTFKYRYIVSIICDWYINSKFENRWHVLKQFQKILFECNE